jgi:hypothetical protein
MDGDVGEVTIVCLGAASLFILVHVNQERTDLRFVDRMSTLAASSRAFLVVTYVLPGLTLDLSTARVWLRTSRGHGILDVPSARAKAREKGKRQGPASRMPKKVLV